MTPRRSSSSIASSSSSFSITTASSLSNNHHHHHQLPIYGINQYKLKRRTETFAEAEQRLKSQHVELGILGAGELTGMCEILFGMQSYMQSTRCLENCDCFYILRSSFERLIMKRNPKCAQRIRELLLVKLRLKNARLLSSNTSNAPSKSIDLFRSLQYKLELMTTTTPFSRPSTTTTTTTMAPDNTLSATSTTTLVNKKVTTTTFPH